MKHKTPAALHGVLVFVGGIWCVFLLGYVVPFELRALGVTPRTLRGLLGIAAMPFLHANFQHLMSNTLPLTVLLLLLVSSRANAWAIVAQIVLFGGLLLWLFGRSVTHVGASGLIYGLIAFLMVAGMFEKRPLPLLIALLVGVLYGGTLLSGILPGVGAHVSWDGHLLGAAAGGMVGYGVVGGAAKRRRAS